MNQTAQHPDAATVLAARLSRKPVRSAVALPGGRNARVWRIETGGTPLVLKQYPRLPGDPRDRLGAELAALNLMQRAGFDNVPRALVADRDAGALLMTWIDGETITSPDEADVDAAAAFLAALHPLRAEAAVPHGLLAAEACLSGAGIARQIARRLDRLREAAREDADLAAFLADTFEPARARLVATARRARAFEAVLPHDNRTLAPADFGFHNALRRPDGTLAFVDFEYFGWDDPAKLTSDLLLHPGTPLTASLRDRLRTACTRVYAATDEDFAARLAVFHPLFALRWTLILLNEFLPERWQARRAAALCESRQGTKARQLAKARAMLAAVARETSKEAAHAD